MPSWKELKRFCEHDGWELYKQTERYYYRKVEANGNVKIIKISMGSGEIKGHMSPRLHQIYTV